MGSSMPILAADSILMGLQGNVHMNDVSLDLLINMYLAVECGVVHAAIASL